MSENRKYVDMRAEPRVPIRPLHHISFEWHADDGKKYNLKISNVSRKGIGFIQAPGVSLPPTGIIEGRLTIAGTDFIIHPQIVFANHQMAGCRITDTREELDEAVEDYFEAELTALRLVAPEDTRYTCDDHQELKVWEGKNNCEVLLLLEGESLVRFKITVFGNVFDGGETRNLSVGEIIQSNDFDDFSSDNRVTLTKAVTELDSATKEVATRFIMTLEEVSEPLREKMLQILDGFPVAN